MTLTYRGQTVRGAYEALPGALKPALITLGGVIERHSGASTGQGRG